MRPITPTKNKITNTHLGREMPRILKKATMTIYTKARKPKMSKNWGENENIVDLEFTFWKQFTKDLIYLNHILEEAENYRKKSRKHIDNTTIKD